MTELEKQFREDHQGKKFADVLRDTAVPNDITFAFFSVKQRHGRMIRSEIDHDRPPLGGVIKEFEKVPEVAAYLGGIDAHATMRYRRAVGVIVRIVMGWYGWVPAAGEGSLGSRKKVDPHTTTPNSYVNETGSLSIWFKTSKRYTPKPEGMLWDGLCSCGDCVGN